MFSLCGELGRRPERARRFSMENMEIMRLTPDKKVSGGLCLFFMYVELYVAG